LTTDELLNAVSETLAAVGFRPKRYDDTSITFKVEGDAYYIEVSPDDPQFFRIVCANFWGEIESEEELERACRAASKVSANTKLPKVFLSKFSPDDASEPVFNVSACVDFLCDTPQSYQPFIARAISSLRTAENRFCELMKHGH